MVHAQNLFGSQIDEPYNNLILYWFIKNEGN